MNVVTSDAVVDQILGGCRDDLADQFTDYRNHVYRGLNYQLRLLGLTSAPPDLGLAWAVHDAGIWTAHTWDYLGPSVALAEGLHNDVGVDDLRRVRRMVGQHHRIRPVEDDPWVETFRLADRIDVFRGLTLNTRLTRNDVAEIVEALPYGGFHTFLARTAASWIRAHPLRPMPMMRW